MRNAKLRADSLVGYLGKATRCWQVIFILAFMVFNFVKTSYYMGHIESINVYVFVFSFSFLSFLGWTLYKQRKGYLILKGLDLSIMNIVDISQHLSRFKEGRKAYKKRAWIASGIALLVLIGMFMKMYFERSDRGFDCLILILIPVFTHSFLKGKRVERKINEAYDEIINSVREIQEIGEE